MLGISEVYSPIRCSWSFFFSGFSPSLSLSLLLCHTNKNIYQMHKCNDSVYLSHQIITMGFKQCVLGERQGVKNKQKRETMPRQGGKDKYGKWQMNRGAILTCHCSEPPLQVSCPAFLCSLSNPSASQLGPGTAYIWLECSLLPCHCEPHLNEQIVKP